MDEAIEGDLRLVEKVAGGCKEDSEADDASHSVERARCCLAAARTFKAAV